MELFSYFCSRKLLLKHENDEFQNCFVADAGFCKYGGCRQKESADGDILKKAIEIEKTGVKHKDACHLACAIMAECDYFITTDDRLLKYKSDELKIETPISFINAMEDF